MAVFMAGGLYWLGFIVIIGAIVHETRNNYEWLFFHTPRWITGEAVFFTACVIALFAISAYFSSTRSARIADSDQVVQEGETSAEKVETTCADKV